MGLRLKTALLMCLAATAVFTGAEAWRSLRPGRTDLVPQELYAPFAAAAESAEYFLRQQGGFVAVFGSGRDREPLSVTGIELAELRLVDRAMIQQGLPVSDRKALLQLLEDLGS